MPTPRRMVVAAVMLAALAVTVTASDVAPPVPISVGHIDWDTVNPDIQLWWSTIDTDHDGLVSEDELVALARVADNDVDAPLPRLIRHGMAGLDVDDNGIVDFADFRAAVHGHDGRGVADERDGVQQVHLSLTSKADEMRVMWVTFDKAAPTLRYGVSSSPDTLVTGTTDTYSVGTGGWNGFIHTALLGGLEQGKKYYYQCGDSSAKSGVSKVFAFTHRDLSATSVRFATWGDMGTVIPFGQKVTSDIAKAAGSKAFDFYLHIGDVAYASTQAPPPAHALAQHRALMTPHTLGWEIEAVWDAFQRQVEKLAAYAPYQIAPGNHERFYDWAAYKHRFHFHGDEQGGVGNFQYSFDYGPVHVINLPSEDWYIKASKGSELYAWLEKDLKAAVAKRADVSWIIVAYHRPSYCAGKSEWNSHSPGSFWADVWQDLYDEYDVDLVLGGHIHSYDRTHALGVGGKIVSKGDGHGVYDTPGAPIYVTLGNGGVFLDQFWHEPIPEWSAVRALEWGWASVEVDLHKLTMTVHDTIHQNAMDTLVITK